MANTEAERIQDEYLGRLRRMLRRVPADIREDAIDEVRSHIQDEWASLGTNVTELQTVLERLGPPEQYGRDLALQLMLMRGHGHRTAMMLAWAALFWASTSVIGSLVVLAAALVFGFGVGMVVVAVDRARGVPMMLIDARSYRVLFYYAERVRFPPETWNPAVIALVGVLPAVLFFAGLYRFASVWLHSHLAKRGLQVVVDKRAETMPQNWQRGAMVATTTLAILGLAGCVLFSLLGNLIKIGEATSLSLPQDFFRTPLTALAFVSAVLFLGSPVLGLLWSARQMRR